MKKSETQYIELFQQSEQLISAYSAPVLNAHRTKALKAFKTQGFPTKKSECYKYTDISKVFAPDYGLNLKRIAFPVNPYEVFKCDVPNLSTSLYFILNDAFYDAVLPKASLPKGVIVTSLSRAAKEYPTLVERYYGGIAPVEKDAITALNTLFAQDGLFIYVPKGVIVDRTVQVVNILRADVDLMVNRRVLIVLEEGAQLRLLMCDHAMDDKQFLVTQVSEIYVGENAHLELYEMEETHDKCQRIANTYAQMQAYSTGKLDSITLHNGLTRNQTQVHLRGVGAEIQMNGCVIADKKEHVDNYTLIHHDAPHCTSHELYKYVLDHQAIGAFAGKILVSSHAQKTSSKEVNANLCSSRTARMYSQPMLEIYADDVTCSHGSTTGQLGDNELFYMRQRGIPEEEARLLLKFAFVGEVIDAIQMEALRVRLTHLVEKRFRGELSKCPDCKLCK